MLTPRQRVKIALEHKEPDRIPIGFESTPEVTKSLKSFLGIETDDELLKRLGVDIRKVFPNYIGPKNLYFDHGLDSTGKDIWGIVRRRVKNEFGVYFEITGYPLKDAKSVEEIENYSWPKAEWFDFDSVAGQIERFEKENEYWIMLRGGGSSFELAWSMRGFEQFLMDLIVNPDIAKKIMEKITDFFMSIAKGSLEVAKGRIDIVRLHDDVASQESLLISKDMWRSFIKPIYKKYFEFYDKYGVKKYYHSCGSIEPIIEDMIEVGLDVLNTLQFSAKGFPKPGELKSRYGDRLCFEGGMDVQTVLPFYTPEDIKKETTKLIKILGENGGYIIESSHALQPDTKPENIMAMYDTALSMHY